MGWCDCSPCPIMLILSCFLSKPHVREKELSVPTPPVSHAVGGTGDQGCIVGAQNFGDVERTCASSDFFCHIFGCAFTQHNALPSA